VIITSRFNIGDHVVIVEGHRFSYQGRGKIGTITNQEFNLNFVIWDGDNIMYDYTDAQICLFQCETNKRAKFFLRR
jgi:hypothetical protein